MQGEYVEFDIDTKNVTNNHASHAVNITGIKGYELMCETRSLMKENSRSKNSNTENITKTEE